MTTLPPFPPCFGPVLFAREHNASHQAAAQVALKNVEALYGFAPLAIFPEAEQRHYWPGLHQPSYAHLQTTVDDLYLIFVQIRQWRATSIYAWFVIAIASEAGKPYWQRDGRRLRRVLPWQQLHAAEVRSELEFFAHVGHLSSVVDTTLQRWRSEAKRD
jgi:hypothetical protein